MTWYNPLTWFEGSDDVDGLDKLQRLLERREKTLALSAVFERPTIDGRCTETAVFPYTVYQSGTLYTTGRKEFPIPENGLSESSELQTFLENTLGVDDPTVADIAAIEGIEAEAQRTNDGEIVVNA